MGLVVVVVDGGRVGLCRSQYFERMGHAMDVSTVGFIGLGQMGYGMAENLLRSGVGLVVYDLDARRMNDLVGIGAVSAAIPGEVADRAEIVFVCVPSERDSENILFGPQGITSAAKELLVIDMTTMSYRGAQRLSRKANNSAVLYNDCPVSGLPARANDGTLTIMFGGSGENFLRVKRYLDVMGKFVVHCGDVGMGQLMKAVNNIVYDVNIAALCEVMPLAVKAGLAPEKLSEVLTTASSRSFASTHFVPRILEREFTEDFSLVSAHKDIENIRQLAEDHAATLPVVNAMVVIYEAAIEMGMGAEAKSAMIKVYERRFEQTVEASLEV